MRRDGGVLYNPLSYLWNLKIHNKCEFKIIVHNKCEFKISVGYKP